MSTRAASAANSRTVKQRLMKLLYSSKYSKRGRDAHQRLTDYASPHYSYTTLRTEYLQRLQELHPDKTYHASSSSSSLSSSSSSLVDTEKQYPSNHDGRSQTYSQYPQEEHTANGDDHKNTKKEQHEAFIELQEAWTNYEKSTKMLNRVGKGRRRGSSSWRTTTTTKDDDDDSREVQTNFTMFGVGCSFADNPIESKQRSDFMDQAGRGWLSAGLLNHGNNNHNNNNNDEETNDNTTTCPLVDDDLFVESTTSSSDKKEEDSTSTTMQKNDMIESIQQQQKNTSRRSLVDQFLSPARRKGVANVPPPTTPTR